MDAQKLIDTMTNQMCQERQKYHLTLGRLLDILDDANDIDGGMPVQFDVGGAPASPHSYRGYYSDLALDVEEQITVRELIKLCSGVVDQALEGYKGGNFVMDRDTPLWKASYGSTGRAITGVRFEPFSRSVVLTTKDVR